MGQVNRWAAGVRTERRNFKGGAPGPLSILRGELLGVFNLHMDALPHLRLRVGRPGITEIAALEGDGTWRKLAWQPGAGSELIVQTPLETMQPLILRLRR